jgi:hypothetical protein
VVGNDGVEALGRTRRWPGGSREVDDGTGSREIFSGKFWQPDGVSEILWGLGFAHPCNALFRGES